MKAVIQRVTNASVIVANKTIGNINEGVLILLGITNDDTENDIGWLSKKIANLRIFDDENGVMNKSLIAIDGDALVISQFTLLASTKKGNRPSYIKAANSTIAIPLYNQFIDYFETDLGKKVKTGIFGANMVINLTNSGPVTIIIDSKNKN